ncbi:MAG: hypothetical protein CMM47_11985 [Rhodospirillaceae bacterium]|nr:hypothetical protein [Rhodospirillaceae bacterium]
MMRRSVVLWLVLAGCFGVSMFLIKQEVQQRESRLDQLNRELLENQEAIRVLRAEWSYLNRPVRIEALIRRHLELRPTEISQRGVFESLPVRITAVEDQAETGQ